MSCWTVSRSLSWRAASRTSSRPASLQLFTVALTLSRPGGLLLFDEPERHLDEQRVEAVISVLEERASAGALVVTATHRAEIIERCDGQLNLGPVGSR